MTTSECKVTVVIPSYNHSEYVGEAIESVLNQTYPNVKLLVIDDGSTDNSVEIIDALQAQHGFTFIKQANMGLVTTLNKALRMCDTEYFCLLASDDSLEPEFLEKQIPIIHGDERIALLSGGNDASHGGDGKDSQLNFYDFNDVFVTRNYSMCAPGMIYRTSATREVGCFNENVKIEDFYMLARFTDKGYLVAENKSAIVNYRIHDSNTHSRHVFMVYEMKKIVDMFSHIDNYEAIKRMWYLNLFCKLARYDKAEARKFMQFVKPYWYRKKFWHGIKRLLLGSSK